MRDSVLNRARAYLAKMPPAISGQGGHSATFKVACALVNGFDLSPAEAFPLMSEWNAACQPPWAETELTHKLVSADAADHGKPRGHLLRPKMQILPKLSRSAPTWPAVNWVNRAEIGHEGGGLADLWENSYPRLEDQEQHTEEIIDRLFPGNPLLCCGKSNAEFDTRPREDWRGRMCKLAHITPSPMSALTGRTKDGKISTHTLSNTGPRRFIVCEFDDGTQDEQAALLRDLGGLAPLVLAVHSGNKSLHGWFLVHGQPEAKVRNFFRYAVHLGADRQLWSRPQFVRMPDGIRDNGNRQTVWYLNFNCLEAR